MPFFTDFGIHGHVGLFDWYTLPVGLFVVLAVAAHGAAYVALKTIGNLHDQAARLGRRLWTATLVLLPVITVLTAIARPDLFPSMITKPMAWIGIVGLLIAAGCLVVGIARARPGLRCGGGAAALVSLIVSAAAALFPIMLTSTMPDGASLNAYESAATGHNLAVALGWWIGAIILVMIYLVFVLRHDATSAAGSDAH